MKYTGWDVVNQDSEELEFTHGDKDKAEAWAFFLENSLMIGEFYSVVPHQISPLSCEKCARLVEGAKA